MFVNACSLAGCVCGGCGHVSRGTNHQDPSKFEKEKKIALILYMSPSRSSRANGVSELFIVDLRQQENLHTWCGYISYLRLWKSLSARIWRHPDHADQQTTQLRSHPPWIVDYEWPTGWMLIYWLILSDSVGWLVQSCELWIRL